MHCIVVIAIAIAIAEDLIAVALYIQIVKFVVRSKENAGGAQGGKSGRVKCDKGGHGCCCLGVIAVLVLGMGLQGRSRKAAATQFGKGASEESRRAGSVIESHHGEVEK